MRDIILQTCDLCTHERALSRYGNLNLCRDCKSATYQREHELGQRHLYIQR